MQKHLPVAVFNEIKRTFSETKQNGFKSTVNARIVHEWLGVKTPFHKWIKRRIESYMFREHVDYCVTTDKVVRGEEANYHCTPDMVKQLAMVENSEKGQLVRLYYLDCEVVAASKLAALEERRSMAVEFRPMTDAIQQAHEDPKPYHFSNEADMINRIVLGMSSAQFKAHHEIGKDGAVRDYMTHEQMKAIIDLQRANTVFITMGMAYDERKDQLGKLFDKAHKQRMIDEVLRLEA